MRTILKSLLFSVIVLGSSVATAQYQYSQIGKVASFRQNVGTYFLNENYGFVFTTGKISQYNPGYLQIVTDTMALYRTTDGGTSWIKIDLGNSNLKNHWGLIYSMYFVSPSHGYMSAAPITMDSVIPGVTSIFDTSREVKYAGQTFPTKQLLPDTAAGIFSTFDSGNTWTRISSDTEFGQLYASNGIVFCPSGYSSNEGKTWTMIPLYDGSQTLIGNRDSLLIESDIRSYDLGKTWDNWDLVDRQGYPEEAYVIPHTQDIILDSSLDGVNSIAGDGCEYYDQYTSNPNNPLVPTHPGITPTLSVTGYGYVIYAVDDTNALWKINATNSDGYVPAVPPPTITMWHSVMGGPSNNTLETTMCDSNSFWLWFRYTVDSCHYGGLTAITIDGIDSSIATYASEGIYHPWNEFPDTPRVTVYPHKSGTYPITVHAHYSDDDFLDGDTTFQMSLVIQPNPGVLVLTAPPVYDFGSQPINAAETIHETLGITAHGCEQSIVDSIIFAADSTQFTDFTFTNITASFVPNTAPRNFSLSFKPTIADTERGSIFIYWFDGEADHTDTIRAIGVGTTVAGVELQSNADSEAPFTIVSVQPNPAQDKITVTLSGQVEPEVALYDVLGRKATTPSPSLSPQGGEEQIVVDVTSVKSGIYFVRLSAGTYVQSRRVVVQH